MAKKVVKRGSARTEKARNATKRRGAEKAQDKRKRSATATRVAKNGSTSKKRAKKAVAAKSQVAPNTANATPEEILAAEEDNPAVNQLLELGRERRAVTYDDILRFFPEAERDIDQLDEAHAALQAAGIEVVDTVDASDEGDDDNWTTSRDDSDSLQRAGQGRHATCRPLTPTTPSACI